MRATPRLLGSALQRGILPAGVATLATLRHEGVRELHWKAIGDALVRFLQDAGPLLTKLGQILATREDLLPAAICRRLERLYSEQPPMSAKQLRRLLKRAYPDGDPFESFEWEPLAVGSIGQVHRVRLRDSSPAVIKLLRPGIEAALERDMRSARAFVDLFFRRAGEGAAGRREAALRVLDDLARAFAREVDLRLEADALEDFAKRLAGNSRVCVPHCYRELSSRTALVLEELRGVPLSALRDAGDSARDDARLAANLALTEILSQVFREGHFHADPHAGNLLLLEDGRLGLIDLGLTGRLGEEERRIIARAVRALLARDADATLRLLLELGTTPADFDLASYREEIEAALRQHGRGAMSRVVGGKSTGEAGANQLEGMVDELFGVTRRHGIWLPESTTLLIKTLVTIEGVARALDPEINIVVKAVPIIVRSLTPRWLRWGRR
jgi:ubiquinone biosynthesis protein